jgi:uncharacterized membrane protein (Fun14 family)
MNEERKRPDSKARPPAKTRAREALRELPRWKKVHLAIAGFFVVAGLGLSATEGSGKQVESTSTATPQAGTGTEGAGGTGSVAPNSLVGGDGGIFGGGQGAPGGSAGGDGAADGGESAPSGWSPFFVKGGFSFFVGFCIGYALRTFFKISAVAFGLVFLAIFGLSYAGILDVHWSSFESLFDSLMARVSSEAESFKGFITGSLPSAGLAAFGLFTGFKRG